MHRTHLARPFVAPLACLALIVAGFSDDPIGPDASDITSIAPTSLVIGAAVIPVRSNNEAGWTCNADPNNQAAVAFSGDEASIGSGSLQVEPLTNTINGNADKFILLHGSSAGVALEDLASFSVDFLIDDSGSSFDQNQFYLNLYTFTPDPNDGASWFSTVGSTTSRPLDRRRGVARDLERARSEERPELDAADPVGVHR